MSIKILLIEGDADRILLTKKALKNTGKPYELDSAATGKEALSKIIENNYDLILCDFHLPDSSALDLLRNIKEGGYSLPFVVVTSAGSEKMGVELMKDDALPIVIDRSIDKYNINKEKKVAEEELRKAYADLKATQFQLIQAEKFKAIGELASGVAHEVKNPLAILMQNVNYLESALSPDKDVSGILEMMKNNIERADNIIRILADFSRVSELQINPEDINLTIEDSIVLIHHRTDLKSITIKKELQKGLPKVLLDKQKMEQVFLNLYLNAVQAMPDGGEITIRTYSKEIKEPGGEKGRRASDLFKIGEIAVMVEVADTGIGVSKENLPRVFDPFFTTKRPDKGTGLGLSVTKNIIKMHKGLIEAESEEGKGTKIILTLKTYS